MTTRDAMADPLTSLAPGVRPTGMRRELGRLVRFGLVGLSNSAVDFVVLAALVWILDLDATLPVLAANTVAFLAASINSFMLNSRLTFNEPRSLRSRSFVLFLMVVSGSLILSNVSLLGFREFWRAAAGIDGATGILVAKACSAIILAGYGYFSYRKLFLGRGALAFTGEAIAYARNLVSPSAPSRIIPVGGVSTSGGLSLDRRQKTVMPTVDVILPVYNEERALPIAIAELSAFLAGWKYEWRILIADNGSTDRTSEVGRGLEQAGRVYYLAVDCHGKGGAIKHAALASDADAVAYMDVDLSTGLEALTPMVDAVLVEGYDIGNGSRRTAGAQVTRSPGRRFLTWGYNSLLRVCLRVGFPDAQCGFKALSRQAIDDLMPHVRNMNWFMDTELLVIAERAGYGIKDIPVRWVEDKDSKVNVVTTTIENLRGVARLVRTRPWRSVPKRQPRVRI